MTDDSKSKLNEWKEIADYLGVSVRTVQAWERTYGLPVQRLPGKRPRVWADPKELDAWKRQQPPAPGQEPVPKHFRLPPWLIAAGIGVGVLIVGILGLLAGWRISQRPGMPVRYRIDYSTLSTFDRQGNKVWDFALPGPANLEAYTFQTYRDEPALFADVDDDGQAELLFAFVPAPNSGKDDRTIVGPQPGIDATESMMGVLPTTHIHKVPGGQPYRVRSWRRKFYPNFLDRDPRHIAESRDLPQFPGGHDGEHYGRHGNSEPARRRETRQAGL